MVFYIQKERQVIFVGPSELCRERDRMSYVLETEEQAYNLCLLLNELTDNQEGPLK